MHPSLKIHITQNQHPHTHIRGQGFQPRLGIAYLRSRPKLLKFVLGVSSSSRLILDDPNPGLISSFIWPQLKVVINDAVYGRLNVNVALNRPTFMSGTYYHAVHGAYSSSRAVDGNKDPMAFSMNNSCAVSEWNASPWWALDLGAALYVIGVLFTNRAEGFGNV